MNPYFKISILAFFLGITAVVVVIHGSSYRGSTVCHSTPADKYESAIKDRSVPIQDVTYGKFIDSIFPFLVSHQEYRCKLSGFPIPYLENDVLGQNPHFYLSRWLLDVLIWSLVFFWLLTRIRNYLKGFFQTIPAINNVTRSAIILEFLPTLFVVLAYLGNMHIREGSDRVENLFDIYGFSQWFLIYTIPVIALFGILLGICGLVYERRIMKSSVSGIEEDLRTKMLGKFLLYLPFPLAIIWVFLMFVFIYGGIA